MHDSARLERKGIPTITLAYDTFESAARLIARAVKLPDMPIVIISHWEPGFTPDMARQEVERLANDIFGGLLKPKAGPPL